MPRRTAIASKNIFIITLLILSCHRREKIQSQHDKKSNIIVSSISKTTESPKPNPIPSTTNVDDSAVPVHKMQGPYKELREYCTSIGQEHSSDPEARIKACISPPKGICGPLAQRSTLLKSTFLEARVVYPGGACELALRNTQGWWIDYNTENSNTPLDDFLNNEGRYVSELYSVREQSGYIILQGEFIHWTMPEKVMYPLKRPRFEEWYECVPRFVVCGVGASGVPRCTVAVQYGYTLYCRDSGTQGATKLNSPSKFDFLRSFEVGTEKITLKSFQRRPNNVIWKAPEIQLKLKLP